MKVPGAIKRVMKKANLEKQKTAAVISTNVPVSSETIDGVKHVLFSDGTTHSYEVEQVYSGVFQSTIDAEAAKKKPVSWELLLGNEEPEPDFVNVSLAEFKKIAEKEEIASYSQHDLPEEVTSIEEANIVTSLIEGQPGMHALVLDLDIPHEYVPSSTPGHGHLYLDLPMTEEIAMSLVEFLADVGVVERGYYLASKRRGYTAVRPPWVKKKDSKTHEQSDY